MNKLMNWMMLSCKKATELIEKKSVFDLTQKEKLMLKFHTSMCDGCSAFQKQSRLIDKLLEHHIANTLTPMANKMESEALQNRIISNLSKK